ncbi:MAG: xanthine dehydrogenase small subunit [Hyphomicrobiaceae bacterium]
MSGQITFLLNGKLQRPADVAPTTTLYQLIRDSGLTGTKEGCAEGDCGACTVALGAIEDGKLRLRAVNSCILLVGQLQGKSVTTVEAISGPAGALHPVQRAMVDNHGSQCGFCTPGFVMSMYVAHAMGFRSEHLDDINDLLAGNLCRCTGYGPIIEAVRQMMKVPGASWDIARREAEAKALRAVEIDTVAMAGSGRKLFSPVSIAELVQVLKYQPNATIVAGATDVGLWVTKQHRELRTIVHIDRIAELRAISRSADVLSIGAAVTYADLPDLLYDHYPALRDLIRRIGSTQVRNSGTIGGNIANGSPIGDMAPALIALDSTLVLRGVNGQRRIPLEDFFIAYGKQDRRTGEFIETIEIPLAAKPRNFQCYKISKRRDQDISAVCGAFNIGIENGAVKRARIAYGGMAAIPKRAAHVEAALIGEQWSLATIELALSAYAVDYQPISDVRASADYRLTVAQNLLRRCYLESDTSPIRLAELSA